MSTYYDDVVIPIIIEDDFGVEIGPMVDVYIDFAVHVESGKRVGYEILDMRIEPRDLMRLNSAQVEQALTLATQRFERKRGLL